ncbi:hypothetical protein ACLI09_06260 [Flavobacterium sp. RHBU_24]|uniref:hypothetical protein n=1 Tax=Flavobacterium sp. RHBU_24 TaxID=3391185 RepID=UPI0039855464
MNKLLTLCLLLPIVCFSQKKTKEERQQTLNERKGLVQTRDTLNYPPAYCLIVATGRLFSNKVDIRIDYGQDATFFEDKTVRDKNGKKIIFRSVMDALNYMKSLGWNFVDAYAITTGSQNIYHYLMENPGNAEIPITAKDNE